MFNHSWDVNNLSKNTSHSKLGTQIDVTVVSSDFFVVVVVVIVLPNSFVFPSCHQLSHRTSQDVEGFKGFDRSRPWAVLNGRLRFILLVSPCFIQSSLVVL